MNKQLEEVIVLLKDIKLLLQNSDSSLLKNGGPVRTKSANRVKHI